MKWDKKYEVNDMLFVHVKWIKYFFFLIRLTRTYLEK